MSQADFFLKIEGITGESIDSKHKDSMQIESWSFGASNSGSSGIGGGGGSGKVSMQDFHFTIQNGKASPGLFLACAQGDHKKEATLTCRKAGGVNPVEYLVVKFTDVLISSFQTGASNGSSSLPMEQISFNFTKIEFEYKAQKKDGSADGSIKVGYDIKTNKKV
jgi:type VI secretion system secreted protein Hcp